MLEFAESCVVSNFAYPRHFCIGQLAFPARQYGHIAHPVICSFQQYGRSNHCNDEHDGSHNQPVSPPCPCPSRPRVLFQDTGNANASWVGTQDIEKERGFLRAVCGLLALLGSYCGFQQRIECPAERWGTWAAIWAQNSTSGVWRVERTRRCGKACAWGCNPLLAVPREGDVYHRGCRGVGGEESVAPPGDQPSCVVGCGRRGPMSGLPVSQPTWSVWRWPSS